MLGILLVPSAGADLFKLLSLRYSDIFLPLTERTALICKGRATAGYCSRLSDHGAAKPTARQGESRTTNGGKIAAAPCRCECRESCLLLIGSGCGAHRCGGLSVPHPSVKGETLICWFRPRKSTGRSGNPKPGLSSLRPRPDSGKGVAQPFSPPLVEGQTG